MNAETQERMILTKLYNALYCDDLPCMKKHLKTMLDLGYDPNLGSMLIHAARNGHLDIVKYLLQCDVSQSRTKDFEISKECALSFAAYDERDAVVKYLIEKGIYCNRLGPKYQLYQEAFNKKATVKNQDHLLKKNVAYLKKRKSKHPSVRRRPK